MKKQPNILFVIMDDQREDSLDWDYLHSPNLRQLAADGARFRNHFVHVPICTPGRAQVLTGCNAYNNGVFWFSNAIDSGCKILPETLKEAGYHTMHVGKWHNHGYPSDARFGFCETRVNLDDGCDDEWHQRRHWLEYSDEGIAGHSTEVFTDAAMAAIQEAPEDKPWFCYLGYHSPHDPFGCPEPFQSMYRKPDFPLPYSWMPEHPFDNGEMTIRDELLMPFPRDLEASRDNFANYCGMITHHDYHIGRIFEMLRQRGEYENTVIVFTSDHGLAVGSHGLLGKENMYDHSCRVPLIVKAPGIEAETAVEHLSSHSDICPTLCELAESPTPASAKDGKSLLPLLEEGAEPLREAVFGAFRGLGEPHSSNPGGKKLLRDTQRMVRTPSAKLCWYTQTDRFQLFDLESDPEEAGDLFAKWRRPDPVWQYTPRHSPEAVDAMASALKQQLVAYLRENEDPLHERLSSIAIEDMWHD